MAKTKVGAKKSLSLREMKGLKGGVSMEGGGVRTSGVSMEGGGKTLGVSMEGGGVKASMTSQGRGSGRR